MQPQNIRGQASWKLASDRVEAAVTCLGGHLGPVRFRLGERIVEPFHIAPWAEAKEFEKLPPMLEALRGDFFCMPFGGNVVPWRGERHPAHGETANGRWRFVGGVQEADRAAIELEIEPRIRSAKVQKIVELREGHAAVYCRHVVSGASGPMNLGHHAMLAFGKDTGRISTSPFAFGQVYPGRFENPAEGGYSSLKAGALFHSLSRVPLAAGGFADLTAYPAREGFEDLVMISSTPGRKLGWTAAVFQKGRYAFVTLKDPRVLASTVMWHSNGGRHYLPWNGRHRGVLGLEEVTGYFHEGLASSAARNPVSERGIPTALKLSPRHPLTVNVIMAVAEVPKGFETVKRIKPTPLGVELVGEKNLSVPVRLDLSFLHRNAALPGR